MTSRALWECPECGERVTSTAGGQQAARDALVAAVREHLATTHATTADLTNAAAQAGGWLAPAGHLVELWGGPDDGARVWCPPGDLPPVIGVARTGQGTLVPVRSATARLLAGCVGRYLLSETATETPPRPARYVYDGRPR